MISIGRRPFINSGACFGCPDARIIIGSQVLVGERVIFETTNHGPNLRPDGWREVTSQPIRVEDKVWIGAGAIILPGVTIKEGAVIAAGAVVTCDVAPGQVVGGVPARPLEQGKMKEKSRL